MHLFFLREQTLLDSFPGILPVGLALGSSPCRRGQRYAKVTNNLLISGFNSYMNAQFYVVRVISM